MNENRPFWSVMIPTYNPDAAYLEESLRSVLSQDPGPEKMQVEVVDDCSPSVDVAAFVKSIGGTRVRFSKTSQNLGLAGCWNTCLDRAHGQWVHILHQDDVVLGGFYERLGALALLQPEIGMAFCRFATIDDFGHWYALGPLEQHDPGPITNWIERVLTGHHIECPAVVVKREVYEKLGGFSDRLNFALDLEMWIRIAAHYTVAYEPTILATYRRHARNETARLERNGSNMMDLARAFDLCGEYLSPEIAEKWISKGRQYWAGVTLGLAAKANAEDRLDACAAHLLAVKALHDGGDLRVRRLQLAARNKLKRTLGPQLTEFIRNFRRR